LLGLRPSHLASLRRAVPLISGSFAFALAKGSAFASAQVAGISIAKKASREDLSFFLNLGQYKLVSLWKKSENDSTPK